MSLQRKRLGDLNFLSKNALVIAVVIATRDAHIFQQRPTNAYRGFIGFTVRDSKQHICNCKYWGSMSSVEQCARYLRVGEIVEIHRPQVMPGDVYEQQRFCPPATMRFTLVVNEGSGELKPHHHNNDADGGWLRQMAVLLKQPHKDPNRCTQQIFDVLELDPRSPDTPLVDLFVAIAMKCPLKDATSRKRSGPVIIEQRCLELVVFDASFMAGVVLTVWNSGWIERAQKAWQPLQTCLFLTGVKCTYSDYYQSTIFTLTQRSLVYENPSGANLKGLEDVIGIWTAEQWRQTAKLCFGKCMAYSYVHYGQLNVAQIYGRISLNARTSDSTFFVYLNAGITKFNVDDPFESVSYKCNVCSSFVNREFWCNNCQLDRRLSHSACFNINVHLSDYTGSLRMCRLNGTDAEFVLGMKVDKYRKCSASDRVSMKTRYLYKNVSCKLMIRKNRGEGGSSSVFISKMRTMRTPITTDLQTYLEGTIVGF